MARVERNKGSYSKLGKGYQVKYPLGWNEQLGKYEVYNETLTTEAEAIARLKEINDFVYHGGNARTLKYNREAGKQEDLSETTFDDFGKVYIEMREKRKRLKKISQRTVDTDKTHIARLSKYIGKTPLANISTEVLEDMELAMSNASDKRNNGKALSGTYIRKMFVTLQSMLSYATKKHYIISNPCREYEKPKRDTKEKQSLTAEQAQNVIKAILNEQTAQAIGLLICMVGGCRLSEMLALTWEEILFEENAIRIEFSMERDTQQRKAPKTENSNAVVPIPPAAMEALKSWQEKQRDWYKRFGLQYGKSVPVVNSRKGNFTLSSVYQRWFRDHKSKCAIPEFATIHTLRHSYITLSISECGTDLGTARGLARHGSLGVTSKYSHALEPQKVKAASKMGALLFPHANQETCNYCRLWSVSPDDSDKGVCWAQEQVNNVRITNCSDKCFMELYESKINRNNAIETSSYY